MDLGGKRAFVTGAARGIGRGCAIELARAGADIVLNDRERTPQSEATVAEIRALGRKVALVEGDIFERGSCERIFERAVVVFGSLDILVSNPAFSRRAPFLELDPLIFEKVIHATLVSGFHVSQLFARHRVEQGGRGKIVFISSIHSRRPYARSVAYNAAKSGLNHMAFTIANELLPHRINVNVIEPGWIDTPGEREFVGDAAIEAAAVKQPWGRLGRPDEIGKVAVFLSSEAADFVTGTSIVVDGGLSLGPT